MKPRKTIAVQFELPRAEQVFSLFGEPARISEAPKQKPEDKTADLFWRENYDVSEVDNAES